MAVFGTINTDDLVSVFSGVSSTNNAIARYDGTEGNLKDSLLTILDDGSLVLVDDVFILAQDLRVFAGINAGVAQFGAAEDRQTAVLGWANAIRMIDGEIDYTALLHIFDGQVRLTNGNLYFQSAGQIYSDNLLLMDYQPGLPGSYWGSPDADQITVLQAYNSNITLTEGTITFNGDGIFPNSVQITNGLNVTSGKSIFAASATNYASINLAQGITPSIFVGGDMWYDGNIVGFQNGSLTKEIFNGEQARVTTQFDKTNTTLSNITGLTANVAAGKTYRFIATLFTTSNVAGGVKAAISGTATATSIIYEGFTVNAGATTQTRATAMNTTVGAVTAVTVAYITITGLITVNAAGTLTVQFAENAAVGTSSVLVGSNFVVVQES